MRFKFGFKLLIINIISCGIFSGCGDLLNQQPKNNLSADTFWKTADDVQLALTGVYSHTGGGSFRGDQGLYYLDDYTDNGIHNHQTDLFTVQLTPNDSRVSSFWSGAYTEIAKCNRFLENIDNFDMDQDLKNQMIAEVRFLRAWTYFNLSQYWGSVPLVKRVLTQKEANSVSRVSKQKIVDFVNSELTEAAADLPRTRPANENGRIIRSAALAVKGRLQLSDSSWNMAATTYKKIMDSGASSIDPDYASLFNGTNEGSPSIIWASRYKKNDVPNSIQSSIPPHKYEGFDGINVYQNLIDSYLCKDGKPVAQSSICDSDHAFKHRDPRLYYNFFLPGYTIFEGQLFVAHPDSINNGDEIGNSQYPYNTGYSLKKYVVENYKGDRRSGGTDIPIIRYAEVLLSYLEAKIKAGDSITQNILDQTINKVRERKSVNMPPVTVTSRDSLWTILKQERRNEFPFEGLRYWDLLRWNKFDEIQNRYFYGMKLTDNPTSYNRFPINGKGYFKAYHLTFDVSKAYQWPIPQREIDVDPNLKQYPEYK